MKIRAAAFAVTLLAALPALASDVRESAVLPAAPAKVWQEIEPFCSLGDWHPAVEKCELYRQDGQTFRTVSVKGGATIVERLVSVSPGKHRLSYTIVSGPLPVKNYVSTLTLAPRGKGTRISWSSHFTPEGVPEADAKKTIAGIYTAGFDGLRQKVAMVRGEHHPMHKAHHKAMGAKMEKPAEKQ